MGFIHQPQHRLQQTHHPASFLLHLEDLRSIPSFSTLFTILPSVSNSSLTFDTEINPLLYLSAFLLPLTLLIIHSPLVFDLFQLLPVLLGNAFLLLAFAKTFICLFSPYTCALLRMQQKSPVSQHLEYNTLLTAVLADPHSRQEL